MAQRTILATVQAGSEQQAAQVLYEVYGDTALLIEPLPSVVGKGWRFKITLDVPDDLTPVGGA